MLANGTNKRRVSQTVRFKPEMMAQEAEGRFVLALEMLLAEFARVEIQQQGGSHELPKAEKRE